MRVFSLLCLSLFVSVAKLILSFAMWKKTSGIMAAHKYQMLCKLISTWQTCGRAKLGDGVNDNTSMHAKSANVFKNLHVDKAQTST